MSSDQLHELCLQPILLQVRAAKQAVAAGALSSKNVVQPGKRLPSRGTTSLEDDQDEEEDDEPAGTPCTAAPADVATTGCDLCRLSL